MRLTPLLAQVLGLAAAGSASAQQVPVSPVGPSTATTLSVLIPPLSASKDRVKLWDALEATARPVRLKVPAGQSIESALRSRCGTAPDDLKRKLVAMNDGDVANVATSDRDLAFIPCPYWNIGTIDEAGRSRPPTIAVRKGELVEPLLKQYTGNASASAIGALTRSNPRLVDASSGTILANGSLSLPAVVRPAVLTVADPQTRETAVELMQPIAASLPPRARQAMRVALSPDEYQLVAVETPLMDDPATECGMPSTDGVWPFNLDEVEAAFAATLALTPPGLQASRPTNIVAIADTGVFMNESGVTSRLWQNPAVLSGVVDPTTRFERDLHGASMVTMRGNVPDIEPSLAYPFARHGTDVTKVVIEPGIRNTLLDQRFTIAVMKLNAQASPFGIHVSTVPTALNYARRIGASVVNLSVVTGATSEPLEDAIGASRALIVSAAGNGGDFPERVGVFPPALPSHREKLIVVGAHDWQKKLTSFSNRGRHVDILAPGCAIPFMDKIGDSPRLLSGTSFAAPFVTYTASLLRALSFPESPPVVRARILASGRFVPALVNVTRYGVILDIARATRFREDSYLPKGSDVPVYGTVDPAQNFICEIASGTSRGFRPREVLKVIPNYPSGSAVPALWTQPAASGPFVETICHSAFVAKSFRFRPRGAEDFQEVLWADTDDIVMRSTSN